MASGGGGLVRGTSDPLRLVGSDLLGEPVLHAVEIGQGRIVAVRERVAVRVDVVGGAHRLERFVGMLEALQRRAKRVLVGARPRTKGLERGDLTVIQTGGMPEGLAGLMAGVFDAVVLSPPSNFRAAKAGMR